MSAEHRRPRRTMGVRSPARRELLEDLALDLERALGRPCDRLLRTVVASLRCARASTRGRKDEEDLPPILKIEEALQNAWRELRVLEIARTTAIQRLARGEPVNVDDEVLRLAMQHQPKRRRGKVHRARHALIMATMEALEDEGIPLASPSGRQLLARVLQSVLRTADRLNGRRTPARRDGIRRDLGRFHKAYARQKDRHQQIAELSRSIAADVSLMQGKRPL